MFDEHFKILAWISSLALATKWSISDYVELRSVIWKRIGAACITIVIVYVVNQLFTYPLE